MTKTKRRKLIIIISVSLFVCVGIIAGIIALVKKQDVKEVGTSAFTIGHINSVSGMYEQSSASIYTSELIACRGLSITPDFESNVKYQVYFYDMDKLYLGCSEVLTTKYTLPKDDVETFYCRIVVYPEKDVYGYDPYVYFFDIPFLANNLTITVDKEQDISKLLKLALQTRFNTWVEDYVNVYSKGYIGDLPYYKVTEDDMSSITNFSCSDDVYDSAKFYNALNTAKSKVEKNAYALFLKYFSKGGEIRYYTSAECDEMLKSKTLFELFNKYTELRKLNNESSVFTFKYKWDSHGSNFPDPGITFDLEGENVKKGEKYFYDNISLKDGESIQLRLKKGNYVLKSNADTDVVFCVYDEYKEIDWVNEDGFPSTRFRVVFLELEYVAMGNIKTRAKVYTDSNKEAIVEHIFDSNGNYSVNVSGYLYKGSYSLVPQLKNGDYIEFSLRFNELANLEMLDTYLKISYTTEMVDSEFRVNCVLNKAVPLGTQVVNTSDNFPLAPIKESINAKDWENVPTWKIMLAKHDNKLYLLGYNESAKSYKIIGYDNVGDSIVQISLAVTARTAAYYQNYTFENMRFEHKDDMTSFIQNSY